MTVAFKLNLKFPTLYGLKLNNQPLFHKYQVGTDSRLGLESFCHLVHVTSPTGRFPHLDVLKRNRLTVRLCSQVT